MSFYLGSFSNGLFGGLRDMASYWSQDIANQRAQWQLQADRDYANKQNAAQAQPQTPSGTLTTGGGQNAPGAMTPISVPDVAAGKTASSGPMDKPDQTPGQAPVQTSGGAPAEPPGLGVAPGAPTTTTMAPAETAGGIQPTPPPAATVGGPGTFGNWASTFQRPLPSTPAAPAFPQSPVATQGAPPPIASVPPMNQMLDPVTGMITSVAPAPPPIPTAPPAVVNVPNTQSPGFGFPSANAWTRPGTPPPAYVPPAAAPAIPAPRTGTGFGGPGTVILPDRPPTAGQPMSMNVTPMRAPRTAGGAVIGSPLGYYYASLINRNSQMPPMV